MKAANWKLQQDRHSLVAEVDRRLGVIEQEMLCHLPKTASMEMVDALVAAQTRTEKELSKLRAGVKVEPSSP